MSARNVDPRFGPRLRALLDQRGMSYRLLAARTYYGKSHLHDLATGRKTPTAEAAKRIDDALGAGGELAAMVNDDERHPLADDEMDALELSRRVAVSDLSPETLQRLEAVADDLAVAYASTPPEELLPRIRRHLAYVANLLDGRKTLAQHRRLLITGGWLALLAATVDIDLRRRSAGEAYLTAAREMAEHADHPEIVAWTYETLAWDRLTVGDFPAAVELSLRAQAMSPKGSSAHIQATAQEGRAWARMGRVEETHDALGRTARLVGPLAVPDRPEHHYRYDPGKALAYVATTLSWIGDPAAESYARDVVAQMETAAILRPRRVASARLDLALALLAAGRPDEAGVIATAAVTSGRVVASNWWRVTEVLRGVERAAIYEAADLRDAYETFRP